MSRSTEHRVSGPARLPVVVVVALIAAVCAGILAMHHLAGGGHAASHMGAAASSHVAAAGAPAEAMVMQVGTQASGTTASGMELAADDAVGIAAGACMIALLTGLLAFVVHRGARWWARRAGASRVRQVRTGGPRPGRGPPRDLLAQLCVLRT